MTTKLNIGCGGRRIEGYLGVDAVKRPAADIVAPAHKIPLGTGSIDEIIAVHVWEHFYLWECSKVLREWTRLLKPGGLLVLEMPNLIKCCENILNPKPEAGKHKDQISYWGLFGDPRDEDPFMTHRWGWTPQSLRDYLVAFGYTDVKHELTQWHPAGREHRDMRLTARRAL